MSTMGHRGYTARIQFDAGASVFHGRVLNIRDVVTFEGRSVEELKREFERSLAVYLAMCREEGVDPEKPFSGQFLVRVRVGERSGLSSLTSDNEESDKYPPGESLAPMGSNGGDFKRAGAACGRRD